MTDTCDKCHRPKWQPSDHWTIDTCHIRDSWSCQGAAEPSTLRAALEDIASGCPGPQARAEQALRGISS